MVTTVPLMAQCIVYRGLDYFVSIMPLDVEEERAGRGYMCFLSALTRNWYIPLPLWLHWQDRITESFSNQFLSFYLFFHLNLVKKFVIAPFNIPHPGVKERALSLGFLKDKDIHVYMWAYPTSCLIAKLTSLILFLVNTKSMFFTLNSFRKLF